MKQRISRLLFSAFIVASLAGCSTVGDFFSGDEAEERLPGERQSVLQLEEELEPDPILESSQITIPEAWNNQYWPQYAGYPNHAMGHVALGPDVKNIWNTDIGEGGSETNPLYMLSLIHI